jgi:hypothetical protein
MVAKEVSGTNCSISANLDPNGYKKVSRQLPTTTKRCMSATCLSLAKLDRQNAKYPSGFL